MINKVWNFFIVPFFFFRINAFLSSGTDNASFLLFVVELHQPGKQNGEPYGSSRSTADPLSSEKNGEN